MYQVVVLPPDEVQELVESFRRLHDPGFHRSAVFLPVFGPFEPAGDEPLARFDGLHGAPFTVNLGPPEARGSALVLPVREGAASLVALRESIRQELAPSAPEPVTESPAVRVGLFTSEPEMEMARRAFASLAPPAPFRIDGLHLAFEDERGLWHTLRERRLVSARRRAAGG